MKPFLKWAGGKYRIVEHIKRRLPSGRRLIEPFVGSGAVFLNTDYPEYLLSDINQDLIQVYETLKQHGDTFIAYCKELFVPENNTPERYYALRAEFNETTDTWRKSALFVYLNRHGYNGLCRYNANGQFNVPFGRYKRPYFPEEEMRYFARKAQHATFVCEDFRVVMGQAQAGDVIYCDPPYVPLSDTANFTDYAAGGFGPDDQRDLARLATALGERAIPVLISNHATDFTEDAYAAADVERLEVRRFISCDGDNRGTATEVLALFGGTQR
ncbi:Dam family site-specific DNA-(adenine-N6)-methyltransferase [Alicyclobacillus macrosporangiidus]|uniref:Dam family site-specific DNA-(adenine-N6)-methyltransferase n=1 Tax=Alicyclobacillus macrosporangiidus TaxID=392015 RepID=UPI000498668B|nr:Dam family site-specific DNA-(adenine-N6)-methyltransferase [Alicyclobacillus macrosporangiidus]